MTSPPPSYGGCAGRPWSGASSVSPPVSPSAAASSVPGESKSRLKESVTLPPHAGHPATPCQGNMSRMAALRCCASI
jgi:hypothetical protein